MKLQPVHFPISSLALHYPHYASLDRKGKANSLFFVSWDHVDKETWQYTRCKYCGNRLQAWTTFISPGEGKKWTLSFQSQHNQSSLTKYITQIERSIITSLLCPHGVNKTPFLIPKVVFSYHILFSTIILFNKIYWSWAYF